MTIHCRIVVISWWSNCVGLECLHRLASFPHNREINVIQVGKSPEQKQLFRACLPPGVTELPYSHDDPGEHSRVISNICQQKLRSDPGIWFMDHDVFFLADYELWFRAADDWLDRSEFCLCLPMRSETPAITQPAFWLSPLRWPADIASFDPIPFQARAEARRPDLYRNNGDLCMPVKDTLVHARDELLPYGRVGTYPLTAADTVYDARLPFPAHTHLGGLFIFAGPTHPEAFKTWTPALEWTLSTLKRFVNFFEACPSNWLAIEDPTLMQRLTEFRGAFHV
jgi:hypothetical protein